MLQTVLLGDVFKAIRETVFPVPSQLLMKIDIELFECRAFLGSPEIITKHFENIPLIAVIMEWTFLREDGSYSEQCPKEKVIKLKKPEMKEGGKNNHMLY